MSKTLDCVVFEESPLGDEFECNAQLMSCRRFVNEDRDDSFQVRLGWIGTSGTFTLYSDQVPADFEQRLDIGSPCRLRMRLLGGLNKTGSSYQIAGAFRFRLVALFQ